MKFLQGVPETLPSKQWDGPRENLIPLAMPLLDIKMQAAVKVQSLWQPLIIAQTKAFITIYNLIVTHSDASQLLENSLNSLTTHIFYFISYADVLIHIDYILIHQEHMIVFYSVSMSWTDSLTKSRESGVTVLVRTAVVPGLYLYWPSLKKNTEDKEDKKST